MPVDLPAGRLAYLRDVTSRIADAENAGEHDEAARLWVVLDDLVDDLDVEQRGRLLKQELIANSDSSTRLVFGPRGAFSRLAGRSS